MKVRDFLKSYVFSLSASYDLLINYNKLSRLLILVKLKIDNNLYYIKKKTSLYKKKTKYSHKYN